MAIQFAGSSSTGARRRRRLATSGDGTGVDASLLEEDRAEIESQLVVSAAAAPWVPVAESRIWIYAALIGVYLGGLTFSLVKPSVFPAELAPLTNLLLAGPHPALVVLTEVLFLALSAQLGLLIGWYRSRGKLDFGGRYRFWPWAVCLFGVVAVGLATNSHRALGDVIGNAGWFSWRGSTVAWLLPVCLTSLPIALFLDRDIRNSRSSLWTIRCSGILWLTEAWFEIFRTELQSQSWFDFAFLLIPVFASALLFLGLWLHARIVAYVSPNPPELNELSVWSLLLAAVGLAAGLFMLLRPRSSGTEDEETAKPRRRKKKTEDEEATAKRKRRTPIKRATSRTRTRTKPADEDTGDASSEVDADDVTNLANEPTNDSSLETNSSWDEHPQNQNRWDEETVEEPAESENEHGRRANGRINRVDNSHGSSTSGPHSRRQSASWSEESTEEPVTSAAGDSSEESDEDRQFQLDSGMTSDQMKGLSKRQKRELKRQLREQERARGR